MTELRARTHKEILSKLGTVDQVKHEFADPDKARNLLKVWRQRNRIPLDRWLDVIEIAKRRGYTLSADTLVKTMPGRPL